MARRLIVPLALAVMAGGAVRGADVPSAQAWLGVFLGAAVPGGVRIVAVVARGPAERGGVRAGDVLASLDETPVVAPGDVERFLETVSPGDPVAVRVLREGAPVVREVRLGARDAAPAGPGPAADLLRYRALSGWNARLDLMSGVSLAAIPDELRVHYGAPEGVGVLVTRVGGGALARETGLRVGDVLTRVGAAEIREPADFQAALAVLRPGATLELEVVRAKRTESLTWGLPEVPEPGPLSRLGAHGPGDGIAPEIRIRLLEEELERLERRMRELRSELETLKGAR